MCLYPKIIKNPKYKANKKNGGVVPPVSDERVMYVPIGCQGCIECRKQKSRDWQVRLFEDLKEHRNGKMVTLTLSDESYMKLADEFDLTGYELDNEVATRAVRLFLERWRKKHKKSLRHWFVTELGHEGTENIHIHGIIWTDEHPVEIEQKWGYGYVFTGSYVNERTVNYIVKYVTKIDKDHMGYKAVILTSPGIGKRYTVAGDYKNNVFRGKNTREYYRTRTGHKIAMPIYWRNKIYSEKEREELWIMKLDKEERWVMGVKVCIKDGEERYYKRLELCREKNKQFGYNNGEVSWEREVYERERRILKQKQRIQRAMEREAERLPREV